MRVIGYTYVADIHCVDCALAAHAAGQFTLDDPLNHGPGDDENGLPYAATDSEGNPVHPVFSTDEREITHCRDCGSGL